jgi:hypothetical protein
MKNKYLLPYIGEKYNTLYESYSFQRKMLGSTWPGCYAMVWKSQNGRWRHTFLGLDYMFDTAEQAMQALDEYLLKKGFYLIKEDEVERFKEKLAVLL